MSDKKFEAILSIIVTQVLDLICRNYEMGEIEAAEDFYKSEVYSVLEREETKVWHFSPLTLFNMYDEEKKKGYFEFPEET